MTEYSAAKTWEYPRIFPNFRNCVCCENYMKDNKHKSFHLTSKICLSLDIICSWKLTVFLKLCSWKTVRKLFLEQIMSADKYLNIFSHQIEAIVYIEPLGGGGGTPILPYISYRLFSRDIITFENLKLESHQSFLSSSGIRDGIFISVYNFTAQ